ncbi:Major facilitator superfamily protein [Hibiscus syriacus]|uniref:Major facilitator superfamily protein n=1 Tax=Hibiscus syriacus TaxID=106335 RepID=A0A6A3BY74_HIBSY|nr:uncharacterized protein LOC120207970 [Hibiscus syriacus]KAE8721564.1 Major facilitator superfamily protein [Hibiscus syriacus]
MYKNQSPYINKSSLLSNPHYKITVATAPNPPPILNYPSRHEPLLSNPNPTPIFPTSFLAPARLMLTMVSWIRTRRRLCLFLLLCSPLLIPFLCATFPILCLAEICFRICRRRSGVKAAAQEDEDNRIRRCEEGCYGDGEGREVGLLQRYLEDQLALVGSVYECGDDSDDHDHQDLDLDCRSPLLS